MLISIADVLSIALVLLIVRWYTPAAVSSSIYLPDFLKYTPPLVPATGLLLLFLLKNIAGHFIYQAQFRFVYRVASNISRKSLQHYLEGTYTDYVHTDSAQYLRRISHQPIEFAHYILSGLQQIMTEILLILLVVAGICWYQPVLCLLCGAIILPAGMALSYVSRSRLRRIRTHIQATGEKTLQHLQEALAGFIESNVYDRHSFFTERYAQHQQRMNQYLADLQVTQGMSSRFFEVFAIIGLFVLIAAGTATGGGIDMVTIAAFLAAAYRLIPGTAKIITLSGQLKTYQYTITDIHQTLKAPTANTEVTGLPADAGIHSISFQQVQFSYQQQPILPGTSFTVQRGELAALSAPSGKGKTTIIHLLLGFLKPDTGEILINEKAADTPLLKQYRKHIAYVKQQSFLLNDSVVTNITLDDIVQDAAGLQQALLLSGTDMLTGQDAQPPIRENGKNISGGQRQRIAIARALYKKADVIILDEPFNELDEASERVLLQHFKTLARSGKIVLLITHHTESHSFCDKIISLHD